jgi:GNAT superfamily N-acetyltransferase
MDLIIAPLSREHDRKTFGCGDSSLNQYLCRYANQDIKKRVSRIYVASPSDMPERVIGYYSLSAGSLHAADLPEVIQHRLPKYPVPMAMLGRLAISKAYQRQGIGSVLLADALQRTAQASQVMAIYAVVVDALNDRTSGFCHQFGFISLPKTSP